MEFLDYLDEEIKHTYKPDDSKAKFKIKEIFLKTTGSLF